MDLQQALECVNLVPMFQSLPEDQKTEVAKLVVQHHYPKGTIIYLAGDKVGHFMILEAGQVKISQVAANGKEQLLKVLQPGDFDGEAALFNGDQRNMAATALVDSNVCQIEQDAFQKLLQKSPQLSVSLLATMSQQINSLQEEKTLSSTADMAGKLAKYLVETGAALDENPFKLPLKKKDIATYLGTTPETISRTFKQLTSKGLIEAKGSQVKIIDEDGLDMLV
ncbi:Crp/Fnr family transcriptional regulator [Lentilactobacillus buchneri]|uniref:Transcriptional regulator, CRP/FNR family n=1 Tax=Lentilactobacillus buchneri subsp. silagei CD034 TaxID=1071400 RepID=J9W5N8_LENBU|nr:Crp/Fnr family transcriptional regulator [Lentilactobacillus buchneri]MCC6101391.1 Crp/Fnr family transcriptional regulator [Lactobacillus sp.]AFR99575.1 transcriptional regulator, CRP/FNR family [Lentilactobacillus buchneri subsp. silagei CD034]MCT2901486.1 Crp/Fnr family transcriptional regulator [Lentilactobacillus buchneri]MCT3543507.1 Crp/Fnr family transcriptional regulator [Lentilactobacillus buchneri]MCT3544216.1 Crp/Fnr family transcriptional regulator [Lentilactobacillus buchneri]